MRLVSFKTEVKALQEILLCSNYLKLTFPMDTHFKVCVIKCNWQNGLHLEMQLIIDYTFCFQGGESTQR